MATTRIGSTKKFADNWENIFGGGSKNRGSAKAATKSKKTAKTVKKKSAKEKTSTATKPKKKVAKPKRGRKK